LKDVNLFKIFQLNLKYHKKLQEWRSFGFRWSYI